MTRLTADLFPRRGPASQPQDKRMFGRESAATVEWSHCVMAYRVALMAVTGQAERFGSAGLA